MRSLRALLLAGGAALVLGAAAHAKTVQEPCPKPQTAWNSAASIFEPSPLRDHRAAFADFDRIAALMDEQMAEMRRQFAEFDRLARKGALVSVGGSPGSFCAQSVVVTRTGDDPPRVTRRNWGDCDEQGALAMQPSAPRPSHLMKVI